MPTFQFPAPATLDIDAGGAIVTIDCEEVYHNVIVPVIERHGATGIAWVPDVRKWLAKTLNVDESLIAVNQVLDFDATLGGIIAGLRAERQKKTKQIVGSQPPTPESQATSAAGPTA